MPAPQTPLYTATGRCPYCGLSFTARTYHTTALHRCAAEDGGCDREFVMRVTIRTETSVHRVEGECCRVREVV